MTCESVRAQLTAYLDGELTDTRGSAVRGHLRGCEACRAVAEHEAALRDGLRGLPPLDPPPSLWAGVQARLAAAEVADAERPAWRRLLARLAPRARQLGLAGLAIAAAIAVLVMRASRDDQPVAVKPAPPTETNVVIAPSTHESPPSPPSPVEEGDVTAELAAAPARATQSHAAAVEELLAAAREARATWSDERKREVDARLATLQRDVDGATTDRAKQKAYRALIRYLHRTVIRGDVAFASIGGAP